MTIISTFKESYALATTIEEKEALLKRHATASTEEGFYYQGLILLQKLYNQIMLVKDPSKIRAPTSTETALMKEMTHLIQSQPYHSKAEEISTRFYILTYPINTANSIEYIKKEMHLNLTMKNDNSMTSNEERSNDIPQVPSVLNPELIDTQKLMKEAVDHATTTLGILPISYPCVLDAVNRGIIKPAPYVTSLIIESILEHPSEGYPIVDLIAKFWKEKYDNKEEVFSLTDYEKTNFSNLTIHQLDQLIELVPHIVLPYKPFIEAYMCKLVPAENYGVLKTLYWDDDEDTIKDYLNRLDQFADKIPEIYYTLKSWICFFRLRIDIVRKDFDEDRLIRYLRYKSNSGSLQLSPRPSKSFAAPSTVKEDEYSNVMVPLLSYHTSTAINNTFISDYLAGLISSDKLTVTIEQLGSYMNYHDELKPMYAKIMLTLPSSQTDKTEEWAKELSLSDYQELINESFITFSPQTLNRSVKRKADDQIKISIRTKNVNRVTIRVYQIDLFNYWRLNMKKTNNFQDFNEKILNLDGLCATWEKDAVIKSNSALHINTTDFVFGGENGLAPEVFAGRGSWVIELVGGNNQCRRAIIQKGSLRHIMQNTTAGHLLRILNENGKAIKRSKIWHSNQYYEADENNNIIFPYLPSKENSTKARILLMSEDDNFCEPAEIIRLAEKYELTADFYVNPEMIGFNKTPTVVVLPALTLNDIPMPLSMLESPVLTVESLSFHQIRSISTYQSDSIENSGITFSFTVPDHLIELTFTFETKIKTLSDSIETLSSSQTVTFSPMSAYYDDGHLAHSVQLKVSFDHKYFIHVFGKNGEVKKNYPISLDLKHSFFHASTHVNLQTNDKGVIELGKLDNIKEIEYSGPYNTFQKWRMLSPENDATDRLLPSDICIQENKSFKIASLTDAEQSLYSLYKKGYNHTLIENFSRFIHMGNGVITVDGLPEGTYTLSIASKQHGIRRVGCFVIKADTSAQDKNGFWKSYLIGNNIYGKENRPLIFNPLNIEDINFTREELTFTLNSSSVNSYAIITSTTFVPGSTERLQHCILRNRLLSSPSIESIDIQNTRSYYSENRKISEENQYILNRTRAEKWAGSNLTKPSLLIYPKENGKTVSELRNVENDLINCSAGAIECKEYSLCTPSYSPCNLSNGNASVNLSFLNCDSPVSLIHLNPNSDNVVTIKRELFNDSGNIVQLVILSGEQVISKEFVVDHTPAELKLHDLRQKSNEESDKACIYTKMVTNLMPNESFTLEDTSEYYVIDSFETLFDTLKLIYERRPGNSAEMARLEFYKKWHDLPLAKKLELHGTNVSYELNLWLKKKDIEFFEKYVKPAIKCKLEKSFIDKYLTDDDLSMYVSDRYMFENLSTLEKALLASTQSKEFIGTVLRSFKDSYDEDHANSNTDSIFDSILAQKATDTLEDSTQPPAMLFGSAQHIGRSLQPMPRMMAHSGPAFASLGVSKERHRRVFLSANDENDESDDDMGFGLFEEDINEVVSNNNNDEDDEELNAMKEELREKVKKQQKKVAYKYVQKTSEWIEEGYAFNNNLTVNQFWIDFLEHHYNSSSKFFLTKNIMQSVNNPSEIICVLALVDLPFVSDISWNKSVQAESRTISIQANNQSLMVFHRSFRLENEEDQQYLNNASNTILLNQEFFLYDPSTQIESQDCVKFTPSQMQTCKTFTEYGIHSIVTNISSKPVNCEINVKVPIGAIPLQITPYQKSKSILIQPYSTWREVFGTFYFPNVGQYMITPAVVSSKTDGRLLSKTKAVQVNVVDTHNEQMSGNESLSWTMLALQGANANVISFLQTYRNLGKLDFSLISKRMMDPYFARQVFDVLSKSRQFFSSELWKFGVYHQFNDIISELLKFDGVLLKRLGMAFESPLVSTCYNQKSVYDYFPVLNARAHSLNPTSHEILNKSFSKRYNEFLDYLNEKNTPFSTVDLITLTVYLIIQDRIGEAHSFFDRIQYRPDIDEGQVQYDYLDAYLKTRVPIQSYSQQVQDLRAIKDITNKYKNIGIPRWEKMFSEMDNFVHEVEQGAQFTPQPEGKTTSIIHSEPLLEFEIVKNKEDKNELQIQHANIESIDIRYYEMDTEVMFSTSAFMSESKLSTDDYSIIKPNYSQHMKLPSRQADIISSFDNEEYDIIGVGESNGAQVTNIPLAFETKKNMFIEISTPQHPHLRKRQTLFSHDLNVHTAESYGIVRVLSQSKKRPLPGVYVKAYVRSRKSQKVSFWKDGYTGLNGVFDYISVTEGNAIMGNSQTDLKNFMENEADKLSLLISSTEEGSLVKEVYPPLA
ncbi:hypothetical protein BDB01DRAFT_717649 [Pilobolus umbonatus]|nr:hypothetical protein BDB01DRAFT_717649 [Pilobolus umbonatus]